MKTAINLSIVAAAVSLAVSCGKNNDNKRSASLPTTTTQPTQTFPDQAAAPNPSQVTASSAPPLADNGPSLDESIEFITEKVNNYAILSNDDGSRQRTLAYKIDGFEGGNLIIECKVTSHCYPPCVLPDSITIGIESVPLSELDARTVTVGPISSPLNQTITVYSMKYFCKEGRKLIRTEGQPNYPGEPSVRSSEEITFADEKMADRVANAFRRAIELCNEKGEKF
jgi:hypothetical protein